jgi:hypothetical protein
MPELAGSSSLAPLTFEQIRLFAKRLKSEKYNLLLKLKLEGPSEAQASQEQTVRVLIAEYDAMISASISAALQGDGFVVDIVRNGRAAAGARAACQAFRRA